MQSILIAYRKQIQIYNPHDLSFSWYILFLFYAFSFTKYLTHYPMWVSVLSVESEGNMDEIDTLNDRQ